MSRVLVAGSQLFSLSGRTCAILAMTSISLAAVMLLSACATGNAEETPPSSIPDATQPIAVSPEPSPSPPPELLPDKSATENLAYFDYINGQVLAEDPDAGGRAYIDALTAAGFTKKHMQVTRDTTTVGLDADSIQFSVRFDGECLIGQTGPSIDGYRSMVAGLLGTGDCLVGATRPIDW